MHILLRLAAIIIAPFSLSTSLNAATSEGQFAARGIGAVQCQSLPDLLGDPADRTSRDQFVAWIAGYISYANRSTSGIFDVMPVQDNYGTEALVELICSQNPTLLVENVLFDIISAFSAGAVTEFSDLVTIEQDGKRVNVRAETLKRLQEKLVSLEILSSDAVDGEYGPKTRDAIVAYQKSVSLAETGIPDPLTLFLLFK